MANQVSQTSSNRQDRVDCLYVMPTTEPSSLTFAETQSVTLEWKLSGLKAIYDSTRGESKSKCIKSAVFGDPDHLWEVIFYPNSGPISNPSTPQSPGEMSSFYLSAVPTDEEKMNGLKGRWARKGVWAFRFEVKSPLYKGAGGGPGLLAHKEAANHVFSSKTVNWGWQSFAKRDVLYYSAHPTVRSSDYFVVTCTVSCVAGPPAGAWLGMNVPPATWALEGGADQGAFVYSPSGFEAGGSGWRGSEGGWKGIGGGNGAMGGDRRLVPRSLVDAVARTFNKPPYSDVEFILPARRRGLEEEEDVHDDRLQATSAAGNMTTDPGQGTLFSTSPVAGTLGPALGEASPSRLSFAKQSQRGDPPYRRIFANKEILRRSEYFEYMLEGGYKETTTGTDMEPVSAMDDMLPDDSDLEEDALSDDGSDDSPPEDTDMERRPASRNLPTNDTSPSSNIGPSKTKVVIRDASYRTWYALLYYLYTDVIVFAPLSSSFIDLSEQTPTKQKQTAGGSSLSSAGIDNHILRRLKLRKKWLTSWRDGSPAREGVPLPVSAKAIYRLADKLDLPGLRQRAFQHIVSQLTVSNCPFEVFTNFTATYEQVRQVEIAFFLHHWNEIKDSNAMVHLWQQIKMGRFDAFTEIWPNIVSNLSYIPSASDVDPSAE